MKFDNETRTRLIVTVTTDFDPADATLEVKVDDAWFGATWSGPAVSVGNGKWKRPARTAGYFAGSNVTASGATVLTIGQHFTETRVTTSGGDIIVATSTRIDVA